MAMGKRVTEGQESFWIATADLPSALRKLVENDDVYARPLFSRGYDNTCHVDQDARGERQAAALAANMCHESPSSLLGVRDATNRIAGRWYFPRSGLPSEAAARIEVPGLGRPGHNADPADGGPNAGNQGVYTAKGPFLEQLIRRRAIHPRVTAQ